jgi:TatA/E family protein of Tat protein translocase
MGIENPVHLIFLAAVALVVLGPKRLPEIARAAGKGMREFRESLNGEGSEEEPAGAAVAQSATAPPSQQAPPQQPPAQLLSGAPPASPAPVAPPDSPV